jgi:hypothetical protein
MKKMSDEEKPAGGHTRILSDSARKRNREEVLANYNKTRINIGHQHDRWMELKEEFRVHQCHCACTSEILTYIINNAGRQASHKKRKYTNQKQELPMAAIFFYRSE